MTTANLRENTASYPQNISQAFWSRNSRREDAPAKRRLTLRSDGAVDGAADYAALTTASGITESFAAWLAEYEERNVQENKGKPVRYHDVLHVHKHASDKHNSERQKRFIISCEKAWNWLVTAINF